MTLNPMQKASLAATFSKAKDQQKGQASFLGIKAPVEIEQLSITLISTAVEKGIYRKIVTFVFEYLKGTDLNEEHWAALKQTTGLDEIVLSTLFSGLLYLVRATTRSRTPLEVFTSDCVEVLKIPNEYVIELGLAIQNWRENLETRANLRKRIRQPGSGMQPEANRISGKIFSHLLNARPTMLGRFLESLTRPAKLFKTLLIKPKKDPNAGKIFLKVEERGVEVQNHVNDMHKEMVSMTKEIAKMASSSSENVSKAATDYLRSSLKQQELVKKAMDPTLDDETRFGLFFQAGLAPNSTSDSEAALHNLSQLAGQEANRQDKFQEKVQALNDKISAYNDYVKKNAPDARDLFKDTYFTNLNQSAEAKEVKKILTELEHASKKKRKQL